MAEINNARVVSSERGGELVDISDPPLMNFLNIVNGLTHVCIGAVTFVTIYCTMNIQELYTDAFRQHIFLCVIGTTVSTIHCLGGSLLSECSYETGEIEASTHNENVYLLPPFRNCVLKGDYNLDKVGRQMLSLNNNILVLLILGFCSSAYHQYILLISQSVMTFSPNNGWSLGMDNKTKTIVHWVMQVLGSTLAIIGSIIQMVDSESNFTSVHGILGFVALIFTVITLISGVRNLLCSNIMNYNYLRLAHSVFGVLTLVAAYTSLCLGFQIFSVWYSEATVNFSIALAVITLIGTLVGAIGNILYKRYLEC